METIAGIAYSKPTVYLLQDSGLGTSEYAGRIAYDSFESSENQAIKNLHTCVEADFVEDEITPIHDIEHSALLDQLAWVHFHHSVLEHCNLTFLIKGTSRGVLQEIARHRIASYTVRSTRYTMSTILNAFVASQRTFKSKDWFMQTIKNLDMFVISGNTEWLEINQLYDKLYHHMITMGTKEFELATIAKSSLSFLEEKDADKVFNNLENGKKKRNVGDNFKWIVTDNWKVDLVMTINLRSFKNFLNLRDSGAAYFQIRWLAEAMKAATPKKYLDLIVKDN